MSVRQSVGPSVEKSKLSHCRLHPTSRLQRLRRLRQLRQLQRQAPPRRHSSLPAAPAAAARTQRACAPAPASPPARGAWPTEGRGAEVPAVPGTAAGPPPDPRRTLAGRHGGEGPSPPLERTRAAAAPRASVPCAHMPNSVAAPLKRVKGSSTRGRRSGFSRAGQNKECAGGGPAGHLGRTPGVLPLFRLLLPPAARPQAPVIQGPALWRQRGAGLGLGGGDRDRQAFVPGAGRGRSKQLGAATQEAAAVERGRPAGGSGAVQGRCGSGGRGGARRGPFLCGRAMCLSTAAGTGFVPES